MRVKKYFVVPSRRSKHIVVDTELHTLVKSMAQQRGLSMAEMTHLLIGPAVTASLGGDYMKLLHDYGFLETKPTAELPGKRASHSDA